jgi:hypothetical protein
MKEQQIIYERGPFWVVAATDFDGFVVMQNFGTHSKRVAGIGYPGAGGIEKAKTEIARRIASDPWLRA